MLGKLHQNVNYSKEKIAIWLVMVQAKWQKGRCKKHGTSTILNEYHFQKIYIVLKELTFFFQRMSNKNHVLW